MAAAVGVQQRTGPGIATGRERTPDVGHVRARGATLKEALIEAGAVRFRPILLTAGAAMLGAWPITLDPVFSGLAWSLIFGLVVSTAFTLLLVPVVYWMLYRGADAPAPGWP